MIPLPMDALLPRVTESLNAGNNVVIAAAPGAGKTTRVPPAVLRECVPAGKKLILLQPRRIAARAAAARIAEEQGWTIGGEVGWQIRFERRIGSATRLQVLTEGILARRLQGDPEIADVGCVILDEFHERSIHSDLAIAMLREIQESLRPDLKIIVMSATVDAGPVQQFLGGCPRIECEGRLHPIEVHHLTREDRSPMWEVAARAVRHASTLEDSGHILTFLPGMYEIRRAQQLLAGVGGIHVLHGSVSAEEQDRALAPSSTRKIILSTNIAETSLTIDGVRTVIDTGWARLPVVNQRLGLEALETRRISLASARQREGRAGRQSPGRCYKLWTRTEESTMPEFEAPEILRTDLAPTILTLGNYGVADVRSFRWFERPPEPALEAAERLLRLLAAVDAKGRITALGRRMAALPLHPRLALILVEGARDGRREEAATLAAILSEIGGARTPETGGRDVIDLVDDFMRGRSTLEPRLVDTISRTRRQLLTLV